MELEVYWTSFAKSQLRNIFNYYQRKASVTVARKLTSSIVRQTLKLKKHPGMGQREELLVERKQEFRYLLYKNYKIIYWHNIQMHRIEVADVFDARQDPEKIKTR